MSTIDGLVEGYRTFRALDFEPKRARFQALAREGQAPRAMVIGCCDSRVDPGTILGAAPGELFVVRNVANLVPPYEPDANYHGTSAALEFAVKSLEIAHIIVLGHAHCGGIRALLEELAEPDTSGEFIGKWMSIARSAREGVVRDSPGQRVEALQRALEQASILGSLDNLLTFPFVHERVVGGGLTVHGWYFDIATGNLSAFESQRKVFVSLG